MRPWTLPVSEAFFVRAIDRLTKTGAAELAVDPATPPGLLEETLARLRARDRDVDVIAPGAELPAATLGRALGATPIAGDLAAAPHLERRAALIDARRLASESAIAGWRTFLDRFAAARGRRGGGLVLALLAPASPDAPEALRWSSRLRRSDCMIWADAHLPAEREGVTGSLAASLAVEVCGWRLDLAKALAQAAPKDLADPLAWLERRPEPPEAEPHPLNKEAFSCPLILRKRNPEALRRRVWRAHLAALFPMLEDHRIQLIQRNRKLLRLDERAESFGVREIEELELGVLRWQLQNQVGQQEKRHLDRLVSIRNRLAHRQPADPEDVSHLLSAEAQKRAAQGG